MNSIEPTGVFAERLLGNQGAPFEKSIFVTLSRTSKSTASIQKDRKQEV